MLENVNLYRPPYLLLASGFVALAPDSPYLAQWVLSVCAFCVFPSVVETVSPNRRVFVAPALIKRPSWNMAIMANRRGYRVA